MLNDATKKKINSLRQILVGKVPDPKSQVDQITNALIYKYMDDMDRQAEAFGGKAAFFVGEYEKYSWRKLMDPKVAGQERMNRYVEALEKMSTNKSLSPIFRDILKGAFLPYRSPETLDLFLHEIDGFTYEHSEELGNAYEYLLSIMGAQGDAGQFRTPRHIIDFIVEVVDPQKGDKVHDPACGTAGFLISAYKHILGNHDGVDNETGDKTATEKPLTASERKELHKNFVGYDISPEMVKLSRVNMFLHSFPEPKISEYDTLSDDSRWDEKFDVILANPPFMSPKGGIVPHKRFGITATRAEVLFTDYIIEHLTRNGRAGIIVPEGIIFQSGKAYKELRKQLVEDGLYAVVSLPSGVFNPYAGVKTSILLFDTEMGRKRSEILFVKVTNDGYDLGAQRRPIDKNDLPEAARVLKAWRKGEKIESPLATWVSREKIAETGNYNLSGDRYRVATDYSNAKWPMVGLGEVLDYEQPTNYIVKSVDYNNKFPTPVLTAGKSFVLGYTNEKEGIFHDGLPVIIFDDFTTATKFVDFPFKVKSSAMKILRVKNGIANVRYVFQAMQNIEFKFSEHKRFWISEYSKIKIPLPPIEVQERIVAELDGYQNIISGARQVVDNWKPKIEIDPTWEKVRLGMVVNILNGYAFQSVKYVSSGIRVLRITNVQNGEIVDDSPKYYPLSSKEEIKKFLLNEDDLLLSLTGNVGRVGLLPKYLLPAALNQRVAAIRPKVDILNNRFLFCLLNNELFESDCIASASGMAQKNMSTTWLSQYEIPLPPLEIQKQIVEKIEFERALVESNKKLIELYEQKMKDIVGKLWK